MENKNPKYGSGMKTLIIREFLKCSIGKNWNPTQLSHPKKILMPPTPFSTGSPSSQTIVSEITKYHENEASSDGPCPAGANRKITPYRVWLSRREAISPSPCSCRAGRPGSNTSRGLAGEPRAAQVLLGEPDPPRPSTSTYPPDHAPASYPSSSFPSTLGNAGRTRGPAPRSSHRPP